MDPKAQTFYADPDTVLSFATPGGAQEEVTFKGGSHTTSDPGHVVQIERAMALGIVSDTPPKKG